MLCRQQRLFTALLTAKVFAASSQTTKQSTRFDSTKAAKELNVENDKYITALKRGDSVTLGNLYTADAKIFNHASTTTMGRAAMVHYYSNMIRAGVTAFTNNTTGLWGSDNNLIVEEGILAFALANRTVVSKGRCLLVWKREDGELKIFRDSFSSD